MNLLQLSVTVQWFVGDFSTSLEMTCLDRILLISPFWISRLRSK